MSLKSTLHKLWVVFKERGNVAVVHKESVSKVNGTTAAACVTPAGKILWAETSWHDAEIRKAADVFTNRKCRLVWVYVGGGWLL